MKKRLFFLIMICFLLCGCTANVNITISGDTVNERISINERPYDVFTMADIAQQYRKHIPAFADTPIIDSMPDVAEEGVKYYRASSTEINGSYYAYYNYDYKFKEYKNASSFKNAFRSSVIQYDSYEKQILITSDSGGMVYFKNHPQLTEVKVNITVTYPVIESNADYVNGNVYTWVFTKNTNKGVYMLLEDENGRSVGGVNGNGEEKKPEEEKENPTPEDPNEDPTTPPGKPSEKKEKNESGIAKEFKLIQEKGKKHPYVVALIAIVVFLIIIVFSMRIKKS